MRVLLVEDNPGDARFVQELLREQVRSGLDVVAAATLEAALATLRERPFDAVLLDLNLPDSAGLDTVRVVRRHAIALSIVVLTGADDERLALEALHVGAEDYLVKGKLSGEPLLRAIRYAIERKRVEESLRETVGELEERTRDLEEFTYSVSHDLKEPLRTIEAFSQFLVEDCADQLDEAGRSHLDALTAASVRMKQFIDNLLLLSRVRREPNSQERIRLGEAVAGVLEAMQAGIADAGARVVVAEDLPDAFVDPMRLDQVLANLVGNALKFRGGRPPLIEIGVRESDGATATVYVRDNGIGIDPQYHERIFGIFQRLHGREAYEGTGAGLAIVRRAVEVMGGRVWVESEPGQGATFLFTLPLYQSNLLGEAA